MGSLYFVRYGNVYGSRKTPRNRSMSVNSRSIVLFRNLIMASVSVLLILLLLLFIGFTETSGQTSRRIAKSGKAVAQKRPSRGLNVKSLSPLIYQQANDLWRIYGRYELDEVPRFLWVDEQVWGDLYTARFPLTNSIDKHDRKDVVRSVVIGQYRMESEILNLLIAAQITFLSDELELTEAQLDRLALLVNQDMYKKHRLLQTACPKRDVERLLEGVRKITARTDLKMEQILFPDQLAYYRRLNLKALEPKLQPTAALLSVPAYTAPSSY